MAADKLADMFARATDRRRFIAKAGGVSLGAMLGAMGLKAAPAVAVVRTHGCVFCDSPRSSSLACPPIACSWCWWGSCHGSNPHQHRCCEGYTRAPSCLQTNPKCSSESGQVCSFYGSQRSC
jgi:hypothetical protein